MGIFSTIFGFCGFRIGISIGLVVGYYLFVYFQPTDVKAWEGYKRHRSTIPDDKYSVAKYISDEASPAPQETIKL